MKKLFAAVIVSAVVFYFAVNTARAEERIVYDFESSLEGWQIPDWALEKMDHVAKGVVITDSYASDGIFSMEVLTDFTGDVWTGAYVEVMKDFDWSDYSEVLVDIYLPEGSPRGLRGRLILTVGDGWYFTEMERSEILHPGAWTTVSASLLEGSSDWKRYIPTDEFRKDIRKIGVRVESDRKPAYAGPIYVDNIRVAR